MYQDHGHDHAAAWPAEKAPRANQRRRIKTIDKPSQVSIASYDSPCISTVRFRMRNEFTSKQHQTELMNFNEYSNRCQKDLVKRHALSQKQFPKNIKVTRSNLLCCSLDRHRSDETSGHQASAQGGVQHPDASVQGAQGEDPSRLRAPVRQQFSRRARC